MLNNNPFVFLHSNSEYSFLNSTIRLERLFKLAAEKNAKFLALTDKNSLYGLGHFLSLCEKYKITPLIGLEIELNGVKVILHAKNKEGLHKIYQINYLISKAITITVEMLESDDIFVIDHLENGFFANKIAAPKLTNFYYNNKVAIFENTIYAPTREMLFSSETETLITLRKINSTTNAELIFQNSDYFEIDQNGLDQKVIDNTLNLVSQISLEFPSNKPRIAKLFKTREESYKKIIELIDRGLNDRILSLKNFSIEIINQRINYELETISKLDFIDYFLIIADAVNWAKQNGIAVGPGRGSASGSLISYLLKITEVNPLQYNLYFERFLNPERVSLPDIDIDIQDNRREEVINYIVDKYGIENCALITTFQTLGAKNSIRDVGRVLNINLSEIDKISKTLADGQSIEEGYQNNSRFRIAIEKYPKLLELSKNIEGLPRQKGVHPAGIIISDTPIIDIMPISFSTEKINQVDLTLDYIEKFGLIKIDFLGLKTLTIIQNIEKDLNYENCFDYIASTTPNIYSDQKTLMCLNSTLSQGIFQIDSPGMKRTISNVGIDTFNDLFAIISLFRPGPMEYIKEYALNKKNPNKIELIHPIYDEIVRETFGIIVYQEQIMQIAQKLVGMSFGQADILRRTISKKDLLKMEQYKTFFNDLAKNNNIDPHTSETIYNKIEKFASYGFNKAHAVAYAMITFKMAYYKVRYPEIFYKALITNSGSSQADVNKYVEECIQQNIKVNSPEINHSSFEAVATKNGIYLPFILIKKVGNSAVEKILYDRVLYKKYNTFSEAYFRLRNSGVSDSVFEVLIKSSVFREFGNQNTLLNYFETLKEFWKMFSSSLKDYTGDAYQRISELIDLHKIIRVDKDGNYFEDFIEVLPADFQEESKNENEFLGNIYNAVPTLNYETNYKLNKLTNKSENWVTALVLEVKQIFSRGLVMITIKDSTLTDSAWVMENNFKKFETIPKKDKIYSFLLSRSYTGKLKILDCKEIYYEE